MRKTILGQLALSPARRPAPELRESLQRLPSELLDPLRLQVVFGCSFQEIAEQLGISEEEAAHSVQCARCLVFGVTIG